MYWSWRSQQIGQCYLFSKGRKWAEIFFVSVIIYSLHWRFREETCFEDPCWYSEEQPLHARHWLIEFSIQYHKLQWLLVLAENKKKWRLRSGLLAALSSQIASMFYSTSPLLPQQPCPCSHHPLCVCRDEHPSTADTAAMMQTVAMLSMSEQEKIISSPKTSLLQNRRDRTWSLLQCPAPGSNLGTQWWKSCSDPGAKAGKPLLSLWAMPNSPIQTFSVAFPIGAAATGLPLAGYSTF